MTTEAMEVAPPRTGLRRDIMIAAANIVIAMRVFSPWSAIPAAAINIPRDIKSTAFTGTQFPHESGVMDGDVAFGIFHWHVRFA